MKYPQSVPMPRDVEDWLVNELEARGIDAVVYSRYILSLLQKNHPDRPLSAATDTWNCMMQKGKEADYWRGWDDEAVKRLMVASKQKCDIQSLVDELCAKLKDIECSAVNRGSAFLQHAKSPPYAADYSIKLPHVRDCLVTGGWPTRGILRASLDQPKPTLPYANTIQAEDCFSLMYCGSQAYYGNFGSLLSEEAPKKEDVKRLYERVSDRNLDRLLFKFDENIENVWKANNAPRSTQDQRCIFSYYNLFSPTLFESLGVNQSINKPSTTWSLGGVNKKTNENDTLNFNKNSWVSDLVDKPSEAPVEPLVEEDLLTSARTHFRPIRSDDSSGVHPSYADGTTFQISNELQQIPFQRSESGTLFLETGKYMEFKVEDVEMDTSEFVPKFRVQHSNEKCCQTDDDLGAVESDDQVAPSESAETSVSDPDEFFFPGDDALALDINAPDTPAEEELEIIVSGLSIVSGKLEHLEECSVSRIASVSSVDPGWEASGAALVENIVNEDLSWTTASGSHSNLLTPPDVHMEGTFDCTSKVSPDAWPSTNEGFWNNGSTLENKSLTNEKFTKTKKKDWREIWGLPSLHGKPSGSDGWDVSLDFIEYIPKILQDGVETCNDTFEEERNHQSDFGCASNIANTDPKIDPNDFANQTVDWSSFGPFADDLKLCSNDHKEEDKWPKLGAALSAYLEESRARALQSVDGWTETPSEFKLAEDRCRQLWNDSEDARTVHYLEYPDPGLRGIWSPVVGGSRSRFSNCKYDMDYIQLRDELTEEGNELLSDINGLQLGLDTLDTGGEIDLFPVAVTTHLFGCKLGANITDDTYNRERAQKERRRRNSSSQKVCDQYMEGECRRPHCRFLHCDAAIPCPFFADASCLKGDACPLSHSIRNLRDSQRAFTL